MCVLGVGFRVRVRVRVRVRIRVRVRVRVMVADRGPDLDTHPLMYKTETRQDSTKDKKKRQEQKTRR